MSHGLFISLDGLDGGGKSTQCRLLAEWLRSRGHTVTTCVDPGGTAIGAQLREIVLHHRREMTPACEAFLFMASRAQLVSEIIRPVLEAGQTVVSDRFLLANVVYQGYAGGLDVEQLWQVGRLSTGGLEPDLTFVLDLPLDQARSRRGGPADRVESRGAEYHQRVRDGFLIEARRRPDRVQIIDASQSGEAVQETIRQAVLVFVEKGGVDAVAASQGT